MRTAFLSLVAGLTVGLTAVTVPTAAAQPAPATYQNPVSASFADTFADPSLIEAKDGWWYAYSTADPLRSGDAPGIMHIARTRNFIDWWYQGTVFDETNRPTWATATSGLWAPDVRYIDGRYVIYFTVTDTTLNPGDDSAIGVATAPTPVGPWTPSGAPVIGPRLRPGSPPGSGDFLWTFDPSGFTDVEGRRYLYFGSYNGGVWVTRVSEDGLTATGEPTHGGHRQQVRGQLRGPARRLVLPDGLLGELLRRTGHRLLGLLRPVAVSAGPVRRRRRHLAGGVQGRRHHPGHPERQPLDRGRAPRDRHRRTPDATGSSITPSTGNEPWLNEPFGINRRPMLIDRIDWIDGWPRTRAGAGPSDTPQRAAGDRHRPRHQLRQPGGRRLHRADRADRLIRRPAAPLSSTARPGPAPTSTPTAYGSGSTSMPSQPLHGTAGRPNAGLWSPFDPAARLLRRRASSRLGPGPRDRARDRPGQRSLAHPGAGGGPVAGCWPSSARTTSTTRSLRCGCAIPAWTSPTPRCGCAASDALVDNVSVRRLATEAIELVPGPQTRRTDLTARSSTARCRDDWRWVRRDPDATVSGGRLNWPLQAADLVGAGNNAGVLLATRPRTAPGSPRPSCTWISVRTRSATSSRPG